jgi:hypothetical protein
MLVTSGGNQRLLGIAATEDCLHIELLLALATLEFGLLLLELLLKGLDARGEVVTLLTNAKDSVRKDSCVFEQNLVAFLGDLYYGLPGDLLGTIRAEVSEDLGREGRHVASEAERDGGVAVDGDGERTCHKVKGLFGGAVKWRGAVGVLGVVDLVTNGRPGNIRRSGSGRRRLAVVRHPS